MRIDDLNRALFPDPDQQLRAEMINKGASKLRSHVRSARERHSEAETCYGQRLLREGIPLLTDALNEWLNKVSNDPVPSGPFFELNEINPKVISYIALKSIVDSLATARPLASAAIRLGALIEDERRFQTFSKHEKWEPIKRGAKRRPNYSKRRYYIIHSEKGEAEKGTTEEWLRWGTRLKLHVGTILITLIRESTGLIDYTMIGTGRRGPARFIVATPKTEEWIESMIHHNALIDPFWMPIHSIPRKWEDKWSGGYSEEDGLPPLPFIKLRNKSFLRTNDEPMTEVMTAVSHLQDTPWVVNGKVYELFRDIWDGGASIGDLPERDDISLPPYPETEDGNDVSDDVKTAWKRKAAAVYAHNASTKSRRILVLNTLGMAKKFLGNKPFYLPHQCDFRGRAYAVPSFLNHMGPDFAKGLMRFHYSKQITHHDQLSWLYIHGANAFGVKGTFAERIKWVEENWRELTRKQGPSMDMLRAASEPFQFAAFCFELAEMNEKGWKGFETRLPCQMDASNNGLQILGMLTRDTYSCEATNVANNESPRDIYQIVADESKRLLAEDHDLPFAQAWLTFGIDRSCAKRPTMTQPYGSTPHSCRSYVNQWYLDAVRKEGKRDPFNESNRFEATAYLSSKIWDAINIVVGRPRQAMKWLQTSARNLANVGQAMYWVSPSGFPVMQAYEKYAEKAIHTKIGDKVYRVKFREDIGVLSAKRQAQGSSPNFVHSLDAACLHLTVNKCVAKYGMNSFAMVHDSYGAHTTDCNYMAQAIRETLYEIFSLDQLSILKEGLEQRSGIELDSLPEYGDFDVSQILTSDYIFS